ARAAGAGDGGPGGAGGGYGDQDAGPTTRCPAAKPAPDTWTSPAASSNSPRVTGTKWWRPPGLTSSTAYPPAARASSAATGTTRASLTLAVVIDTVTGAWSKAPAARGWARGMITVTFGLVPPVATLDTPPGVTWPVGKVIITLSPAFTCDCCAASRAMVTTCRAEVAANTGPAAGAPRLAEMVVTRIADGKNTAWPSGSAPVWGRPRRACSFSSAYPVAAVQYFEGGSSCERVAQPGATGGRLSARTWAPSIPADRARQAGTRP